MASVDKTVAMKLLEGKRVPYEVVTFPADEHDAETIAEILGVPPDMVFKTLVVTPSDARSKPLLVMIPANKQLDLKKLATSLGVKKVKMATHAQAEDMTGLQVGGISALALLNRGFRSLIDASCHRYDEVYVSAGKRGINLKVAVDSLIDLTGARVVDVAS